MNLRIPLTPAQGYNKIFDNGDETDFEDFRKPTRRAFNGWAQAIVRARPGQSGTIRVTAKAAGLAPAMATVRIR